MSDLTVITNNIPRDILDAWELSERERAEFDYLDWLAIERGEESASFVRYCGETYDLGEFQTTSGSGRVESVISSGRTFVGTVYHVRLNGWACVESAEHGHIASGPAPREVLS